MERRKRIIEKDASETKTGSRARAIHLMNEPAADAFGEWTRAREKKKTIIIIIIIACPEIGAVRAVLFLRWTLLCFSRFRGEFLLSFAKFSRAAVNKRKSSKYCDYTAPHHFGRENKLKTYFTRVMFAERRQTKIIESAGRIVSRVNEFSFFFEDYYCHARGC